jgi:hypothetical protein
MQIASASVSTRSFSCNPRSTGFKCDSARPSTAASPLPINHATGRNAIYVPLPSVAARDRRRLQGKAFGAKADRIERKKVMALVQAREIDAILVTELSRWGRSTIDLVQTLRLGMYPSSPSQGRNSTCRRRTAR